MPAAERTPKGRRVAEPAGHGIRRVLMRVLTPVERPVVPYKVGWLAAEML